MTERITTGFSLPATNPNPVRNKVHNLIVNGWNQGLTDLDEMCWKDYRS